MDVNSFSEDILLKNNSDLGTWINENNKWWYKHKDRTLTKDAWELIDNKWYLFDAEGWIK